MALRNAFENMLTERTGRLILAAVQYARDANDRMRVSVDNQPNVTVAAGPYMNGSSTAGTWRAWNDVNAVFTVDQREMMRQQSQILAESRRQKWVYS